MGEFNQINHSTIHYSAGRWIEALRTFSNPNDNFQVGKKKIPTMKACCDQNMSPKLLLWFHPDVKGPRLTRFTQIFHPAWPQKKDFFFFLTTVMQIKKCHMSLNQHWGDNFE